jgi:hypothetical protein
MQVENKPTEQSAFLSDGFSGKRFDKQRLENFVAKSLLLSKMNERLDDRIPTTKY